MGENRITRSHTDQDEGAVGMYPPVPMSPTQYEHSVLGLLSGLAHEGLENIRVEHQGRVRGADGDYTIDGTIRYSLMGAEFLVLLEAKLNKRPVGREAVQTLHAKVESVGAHKGILASSSGFQRGALRYAAQHGIALAQIVDNALTYEVRARNLKSRFAPGTVGFAIFHVHETERGYGFTRLDRTGYVREMFPGLQDSRRDDGPRDERTA